MRLSIDISPEQHRVLKAAAALEGQSIKSYVLDRVLPKAINKNQSTLTDLERELERRLGDANRGELATRTVREIFDDTLAEVTDSG
ncbi:MAG: DUF1778 domain-containing protein [Wenzhouxiangella sp.]|jgi:hypothetical protein|nr:DUF1778 domain-containing protein [Wenzhouxiangella sp.]